LSISEIELCREGGHAVLQSVPTSYVRSHEALFHNLGSEDVNNEFKNLVLLADKGSRGHPHSQVSIVTEKPVGYHRDRGSIFGWYKILKDIQTSCGTD